MAVAFTATAVFAQEETANTDTDTSAGETTTDTTITPNNLQERLNERREELETRAEEIRDNVAERQAEFQERREEIQTNIAERRAALSEQAKTRIINLAANISNRLDAVVARLQNIVNRMNSRIEKLQELGVNTEVASQHVNDAQDAISAAMLQLGDIDETVTGAVTAEDPRTAWQTAKTTYLAIKENIISAHTSLRAAAEALKTAIAQQQAEVTEEETE